MKISRTTRIFSLVIALQFLNVQIQSAFGTEATTTANPELAHALKQVESKIGDRMASFSEEQVVHYAYRIYRLDVRLRNRVFKKSNQEIQKRIEALANHQSTNEDFSAEEIELQKQAETDANVGDLEALQNVPAPEAAPVANRERILQNADTLLLQLGSTAQANGQFSRANFNEFQNHFFALKSKGDLRAPAASMAVKVILALLLICGALISLFYVIALTALAVGFGNLTFLGGLVVALLVAGIITGVVFGLKGIFSSTTGRRNSDSERLQLTWLAQTC